MKASFLLPVLALAALLTPGLGRPTHASPPPMPLQAPQLGPWIDVWMGTNTKNDAVQSVAYNSLHDEYLVVWTTVQDANTTDVWARRVGADGSLRSWFNVASLAGKVCDEPHVAYSPQQDLYMVVFTYEFSTYPHDDKDIYARLVAGDGSGPFGGTIYVVTDTDNQFDPAIAYNSRDDEFLVAWTNQHDVGGPNEAWTVQMQRLRASDGSLVGVTRSVPGGGMGVARFSPGIAYNPARNQYLIAYNAEAAAPGDVRSIVAPADLSSFGSEMHVWNLTSGNFAFGADAAAAGDGYLVAWNVYYGSVPAPSAVLINGYARRVSGTGVPLGASSGIQVTAAVYPFDTRRVSDTAYVPGYGFLVGLGYGQSTGSGSDTHGAHILAGANTAASPFAIDVSDSGAWGPTMACAPQGVCLVAETYWLYSWSKTDIRARFVYLRHLYLPATLKGG